jgi:hypothetical protein
VIARNVRDDRVARTPGRPPKKVILIYGGPKDWYMDNVVAALGRGSALRLFFSDPDLDVSFLDSGDARGDYEPATTALFHFDYLGRLRTGEEMNRK